MTRRELIDIHDRLSASEIAMILADDPTWRLPSGCWRRKARMLEAMWLMRFGVDRRTVRHERMETMERSSILKLTRQIRAHTA